jgi:hypothetical protein
MEADTIFSPFQNFTIDEVTDNRHFIAHFQINRYTILLGGDPITGGTVSLNNTTDFIGTFDYGTEIIAHAYNNILHNFLYWTEGDDTLWTASAHYQFMVETDRILIAHFEPKTYSVHLDKYDPWGGDVHFADGACCDSTGIEYNAWIEVEAVANPEYDFKGWYEDSINGVKVCDNAIFNFPVTQDLYLVARFVLKTFTVTLLPNPSDWGSVDGGGTNIPYGTARDLTATPFQHYLFDNWTTTNDEIISASPTYTISVISDTIITANFKKEEYHITVEPFPPAGGNVSGDGWFLYDEMDTVKAVANPGFAFLYWTENDAWASYDADYDFPVTRARHLVAHFDTIPYTVTLVPDPIDGGMVFGGGTYLFGEEILIKAEPLGNYHFVEWTENGVSFSSDPIITDYTVTHSCTLVAHFAPKKY